MSNKKAFASWILAFLNAFFIFCAAVLWVLFLLSLENTIVFVSERSGYEKKCVAQAEKQMNVIALAGGFGNGFFDGILDKANEKTRLKTFVNSTAQGKNFDTGNSEIKPLITDKIFRFAEEKIHVFSLETKEILEETATLCVNETQSAFYPALFRHFCAFCGRFNTLFLIGASVFTVLFFTSVFLLFKRDKTALKTSLLSAFLTCFAGPVFLMLRFNEKALGISHFWLKSFFTVYVNLALAALIFLSFVFLIFALCIKKHPASF